MRRSSAGVSQPDDEHALQHALHQWEKLDRSVYVLIVKGNLAHRLTLVGVEKRMEDLNEHQVRLREVAQEYPWEQYHPGRPLWACGAFVFLTREHANDIQLRIEKAEIVLQSKHMLVSHSLLETLQNALDTPPECVTNGREAFLYRRHRVGEGAG